MGPPRRCAHAASCSIPAPHQLDHEELSHRHRSPLMREGPEGGAHSPGAGFGDRRGRSRFVVGSAPVPRPTWARGPPTTGDRPAAAVHGETAGSGGDDDSRMAVSPPAAAAAAARADSRGSEGPGLGSASGGAGSPAAAQRGQIAEAGGSYRSTGAQDSGRQPYCYNGSTGGFSSLAKRDSPCPREGGAGGRDAAAGRSHVQGGGADARDGAGHVAWDGRVGRQPGSGNYERRPSAGLHQGSGGYGSATPSSSYKYGGWAGSGSTAASWRAAPPPPPPSSVGVSSPPSVVGSLSAAKTPPGANTPYGTSPPSHYYSSSWQRTSAVWGHQGYGSSQQGVTGGSHSGCRSGGTWDRDRDRDRDRGGGAVRHIQGQGQEQGHGHQSLRYTAGGEDSNACLLGTSAPVDVPSHMYRARGQGRRGGSPAGVHGDVPSLGASPPAVGGSYSERGHGLAWPGRGHTGRKGPGAGAGPGGSPAPHGSIAAAAGGAGPGACGRAALRRERSGKGPRSFAEAACACAEAVQVEVEPGWELVSHGRRGARVPQSAC